MKAELTQVDQRIRLPRDFQLLIATLSVRRPDAQSAPSGPQTPLRLLSVKHGDMKLGQLYVGVKVLFKTRHDTLANERLESPRRNRKNCYNHNQGNKHGPCHPQDPTVSPPERSAHSGPGALRHAWRGQ